MDYMSRLTGKDEETLFAELTGVVFLNPDLHRRGRRNMRNTCPRTSIFPAMCVRNLTVAQGKAEQDPQYQMQR